MELQVKEEKGFSVIEMLLVLIIIILLVFVGYFIYHTQKTTNATLNSASKISAEPAPKVTKKAAAPVAATTSGFLDIKEWGVKFPVSGAITDAIYAAPSHQNATTTNAFDLATKSLIGTSCGLTDNTAQNTIVRFSTDPSSSAYDAQLAQYYVANSTKVGNYYYAFMHAQAACDNNTSSAAQTQASANATAFVAAIKSTQTD